MTDFMSGIGDAVSGAAGAIGDAAGSALDFVMPTTERRGAGFSFQDLINTASDVGRNSALGGVSMIDDVLRSDTGWRQKLFAGSMVGLGVAGAAAGARQLAATRKIERQFATTYSPAMTSRTSGQAVGLGLSERFRPTSPEASAVVRQHPGIRARSVDVLGAQDPVETARSLVSPRVAANPELVARPAAIIAQYADELESLAPEARLGAAQLDFAKIDTIIDSKILRVVGADRAGAGSGFMNAELERLWKKFKDAPDTLSDEDAGQLMGLVRTVGDATDMITEPDLTFSMTERVTGVYLTPEGPVLNIESPVWDRMTTLTDPVARSARLRQLNVRALSGRGKEIFERLLDMGLDDQARRGRGEGGILPKPLEIGTGWYPKAGMQIDDALTGVQARIPWLSKEKLTAAVSLTSEAEQWEGNITLAVKALESANAPEVLDPGFQKWLRDGGTIDSPLGRPDYSAQMKRLHLQAKRGNQLSERDFSKVLRLVEEDADSVFRTTNGRKQKSFYLNLMGDRSVVTVDRHQHDAFFGLATSSDFKILEASDLDDSVYDLIQDVVFQIADERPELTPSDVQGVVWEVWRILKDDHLVHQNQPWEHGDPFRMREADGGENTVYQALLGEQSPGLRDALAAKGSTIPYVLGKTKEGLYTMPDQTAGFVAKVNPEAAQRLRHLQPALTERDGLAHWAPSRPRKVTDLERQVRVLNEQMKDHVVETWANDVWPGGHPALLADDVIMLEVPFGADVRELGKLGQVVDPGVAGKRSQPVTMAKAKAPDGAREATVAEFLEARGSWGARTNEGGRAFGVSPLPEPGDLLRHKLFLTENGTAGFAIAPDGDLQQVFNGGRKGLGEELVDYAITQGARKLDAFDDGLPDYYKRFGFTETERVAWDPQYDKQARPEGPDVVYMALDPSSARSDLRTRKVALKVPPAQATRIHELADEVEKMGYGVDVIYSGRAPAEGWQTVREHVYTDGVNTSLVRTRDAEIDSYHGVHAWARRDVAKLLEKKNPDGRRTRKPQVEIHPSGAVLFDGSVSFKPLFPERQVAGRTALQMIAKDFPNRKPGHGLVLDRNQPIPTLVHTVAGDEFGSPAYATYVDGRVLVNVPSRGASVDQTLPKGAKLDKANQVFDLQEASEIKDALLEMGVPPDKIEIRVGPDAIGADLHKPEAVTQGTTTVHGYQVPALKAAKNPLPQFMDRFKLEVEPTYRNAAGKVVTVGDEVWAPMAEVLETFYSKHMEMARTIDLRRMGVSDEMPNPKWDKDTVTAWEAHGWGGAEIVFNGRYLADPKAFIGNVDPNWTALGDNTSPAQILSHELGHAMHDAVRRSFRTKGAAEEWQKKTLKPLYDAFAKQHQGELSNYGKENLLEFVAEAASEAMFSPNPRPLALKVYALVVDQFEKNTTVKKTTTWFRRRAA